jgi:hypothetical protein
MPRFDKFAELAIYKKDIDIEVPQLGLSAHYMRYLSIDDIMETPL